MIRAVAVLAVGGMFAMCSALLVGSLALAGFAGRFGASPPAAPRAAPSAPVDPARIPPGFVLPVDPVRRAVVTAALAQVGKPYRWGAKGPSAFDCSGLTQAAWASAGVDLAAGTIGQVRDGTPIADLARLTPGDLLFIPGSYGTAEVPRHVGLYLGGGVVADARDTRHGVMLSSVDTWRHEIVAVRRIAAGRDPP